MPHADAIIRRHGAGGFPGRASLIALAFLLLAPPIVPAVLAADADPGLDPGVVEPFEPLRCVEVDGGVILQWDPIMTILPILGFTVYRDGEAIARLPEGSTSSFDPSPGAGTHLYAVEATNWDGNPWEIGKCEIVVGDSGLRCKVDGDLVHLEWGPIMIDVLILEFRIFRDRVLVGTVPGRERTYTDRVGDIGAYGYLVTAVTGPDSAFVVGRCLADVRCFGLDVEVGGLDVILSWGEVLPDPGVIVPVERQFIVTRDGVAVGVTHETKFVDTVPAPGLYAYRVYVGVLTEESLPRLVGACEVLVPGPGIIPPPRRLVCTVLEVAEPVPFPLPEDPEVWPAGAFGADGDLASPGRQTVDTDGDGVDDTLLPGAAVALRWENPVDYDRIVIARNKAIIATLPRGSTSYVDRVLAGGRYIYSVTGEIRGVSSAPATCEVEVPPGFVPPPQDFRCVLVSEIVQHDDMASPVDVVLLTWWNPVRYAKLVLLRDRGILAELPGSAMAYRDVAPPPGEHVYGIYGVAADGSQSPIVTCWIFVGPVIVPPVEDLKCAVLSATPDDPVNPDDPANATAVHAVALAWRNAARYDAIEIRRNGGPLAELPGSAQTYSDRDVAPGIYRYEVVAMIGGRRSLPALCEVVVPGPPARNVLYFTPRPATDLTASDDVPPMPPYPGTRLTCRASNARELQGWSFGVATDPRFVAARAVDLRATETQALNGGAGPDFLFLEILDGGEGVVMAAVIDTGTLPPFETLLPAASNRILNIEYAAGPAGRPGEVYAVRYTGTLGSPPVSVLFVVDGFEVAPATRTGWVSLPTPAFIRGDVDENGKLEMTDAIRTLGWLFLGGEEPGCLQSADANGSGEVNIADPIYILQFLFVGGPMPPHPYPDCGTAPVPLGCKRHEFCGTGP